MCLHFIHIHWYIPYVLQPKRLSVVVQESLQHHRGAYYDLAFDLSALSVIDYSQAHLSMNCPTTSCDNSNGNKKKGHKYICKQKWTPFSYWKTPNFGELGNATLQTKTYECGVWVNITLTVHLILSTGAEQQQSQLTKQTSHTLHESAPKCTYFCSDIWIDNWEYVILNR